MTLSDICERILLAEDDPSSQMVAIAMLKRLGHDADVANNGFEVLRLLRLHKYYLILMDIMMPKMDGIATSQEIRRRLTASELPKIVAFTAYDHPDVRKKCIEAGMVDYISKPVSLNELKAILMKYQKILPEDS